MTPLDIVLAHDSPAEQQVRDLLVEATCRFDLEPWLFTRRIVISEASETNRAVLREDGPEIHLRAGFRSLFGLLTMFIHEQLHVHLARHPGRVEAAVLELRRLYPSVPVGGTQGARSERSTYEHLLLCTLEQDAVNKLFRSEPGPRPQPRGYHFIYGEVERNGEALRSILNRHGLRPPPVPGP